MRSSESTIVMLDMPTPLSASQEDNENTENKLKQKNS
jgi:hypothetical protein